MSASMRCDGREPYVPKRILAVGAHPDDIDFGASGSIAAWARAGCHVEYLIITNGSKGSAERNVNATLLIETRQKEQRAAAETLGAQNVHFLNYEDGELQITMELKRDIVRLIRMVRPDTVIVMDPSVLYSARYGFINHPDHRAAGQATLDAVFPLARDHLSFPELLDQAKLEPHNVDHLLLLNFEKQNCYVDITDTFDLKLAALGKHVSQLADVRAVSAMLRTRAEEAGKQAGFAFAESFLRIDIR